MIRRYTDLAEFRAFAEPLLVGEEAANNLPLGLLSLVRPSAELLMVDVGGVGIALQTGSVYNLIVSALPESAIAELVDWLVRERIEPPGIVGPREVAAVVARELAARRGREVKLQHGLRAFENKQLTLPRAPTDGGQPRAAVAADAELIVAWNDAFNKDVGSTTPQPRSLIDERIARGDFWLWQTDRPVAMAGIVRRTPGGAAVGYVYTPPELRGRGYASSVVAALTAAIHADGRVAFLFTDLANPTSNKIYQALGYHPVAHVDEWRFI
jgi:RimJ/RimL family protein N-acetyltransferase